LVNWCKNAPKKVKKKNVLLPILENIAKFYHTPWKRVLPYFNRFLVLSFSARFSTVLRVFQFYHTPKESFARFRQAPK
jgi:hypothetical protein